MVMHSHITSTMLTMGPVADTRGGGGGGARSAKVRGAKGGGGGKVLTCENNGIKYHNLCCLGASGTRKHTNIYKHIKLLSHYSRNTSNNEFDIPSIIFERFAYLKWTPKAYMLKISPPAPPPPSQYFAKSLLF